MYLFGCCARKHDDADREGSLLSPKVNADNQPRRSKRSKKPHYGLVSQGGQALPLSPSRRDLEVYVSPGEPYGGGNYCLALILPESSADASVADEKKDKNDGGGTIQGYGESTIGFGELSVSSSVRLLDEEESDDGIIQAEDNVGAAEEEVCYSKSSDDGSRWSTLCEASNGSSARDGSVAVCAGRKVLCESPDTGISWSFPDIASSDDQGNCLDSPRVHPYGPVTREVRTVGCYTGLSDFGEVLPREDSSEYAADNCAPGETDDVPDLEPPPPHLTSFVQENVFVGSGEKFSNDVVRVTQYVLETINRVCDSFENQGEVDDVEDQEPVDQALMNDQCSDNRPESPPETTRSVDNIPDNELFNSTQPKNTEENHFNASDLVLYKIEPANNTELSKYTMSTEPREVEDFEFAAELNVETTSLKENCSSFDRTVEISSEDNIICYGFEIINHQSVHTDEIGIRFNKTTEHVEKQRFYDYSDSQFEIEDFDDDYQQLVYTNQEKFTGESDFYYDDSKDCRTVNIGILSDDLANFYAANVKEDEYLELIADRFVREVLKRSVEGHDDTGKVEHVMNVTMDKSSTQKDMALGDDDEEWEILSGDNISCEQNLLSAKDLEHQAIRQELSTDDLNISQMESCINFKELETSEPNFSLTDQNVLDRDAFIAVDNIEMLSNDSMQPVTTDQIVFETKNPLPFQEAYDEEQLILAGEDITSDDVDYACIGICSEDQVVASEDIPIPLELTTNVPDDINSFGLSTITETEASNLCTDVMENSDRLDLFDLTDSSYFISQQYHEYETLLEFSENVLISPPAGYCEEESQESEEGSDDSYQRCHDHKEEDSLEVLDLELLDISQSSKLDEVENSDHCFSSHSADESEVRTYRMVEDELITPVEVDEHTEQISGFIEMLECPYPPIETSPEGDLSNENETLSTAADLLQRVSKSELVVLVDREIEAVEEGPSKPEELSHSIPPLDVSADDGYSSFFTADSSLALASVDHFVPSDSDSSIKCQSNPIDDVCDEIGYNLNGNNNQEPEATIQVMDNSSEGTLKSESLENVEEDQMNANIMLNLSDVTNYIDELVASAMGNKTVVQIDDAGYAEFCDDPSTTGDVAVDSEKSPEKNLCGIESVVGQNSSNVTVESEKSPENNLSGSESVVKSSDVTVESEKSPAENLCGSESVVKSNDITVESEKSSTENLCAIESAVNSNDITVESEKSPAENFCGSESVVISNDVTVESEKSPSKNLSDIESVVNSNDITVESEKSPAENFCGRKSVVESSDVAVDSEKSPEENLCGSVSVVNSSDVTVESDKSPAKDSVDIEKTANATDGKTCGTESPAVTTRRHGKTRFTRTRVQEEDIFALPLNTYRSKTHSEGQHALASTVAASLSSNLNADFFSAYIIDLSKNLIEGDQMVVDQAAFEDSTSADITSSSSARKPRSIDQTSTRLVDDMYLLSPDSCRDLANFVEMEDSTQRPPVVRRSISLKTSPTGTPRKKKAVRFADALGLDLESIRHIRSSDDPTTAPTPLHLPPHDAASTLLPNTPPSSAPLRYLYMEFPQPRSLPDFLCKVYDQKVSLESCTCDSRDLIVTGCIRVYNTSFRKEVLVRYTMTAWATHRDTPASHLSNSSDGTTDQFSFSIVLPGYFDVGSRLEFAIWYRAGEDLSESHWDNNQGANYSVNCYSNCNGGNSDSPAWLHFL